jgi:hypothetical protein
MGRTIIETRYGGGYEGGAWAAFRSGDIPEEAHGEDVECRTWWEAPTVAVGVGATPDEALDVLDRVVRDCRHPQPNRHPAPAGFTCSYCDLLVTPSAGTVEDLLAVVGYWSSLLPLNLWVPRTLTLHGNPIDEESAVALVGEAVQALGLVPKGSTQEVGGRVLHFGRH